jgi:PAS domain S-box-containing protein
MTSLIERLFAPSAFSPHGFCLLWEPGLIWLHVGAGLLTALAYFSIPAALLVFLRQRPDFRYRGLCGLAVAFITLCGTSHLVDVVTLWQPLYWLQGVIKAMTAAVSVVTAVLLWPLIPKAIAIPTPAALEEANARLEREVQEKTCLLADLMRNRQQLHDAAQVLEARVTERTESLANANATFRRRLGALPAVIYGGRPRDGELDAEHVSDSIRQVTGWEPDALSAPGRWQALMEPEAAAGRADFLAETLASGQATAEYRLRRPDGSWMWVRDHLRVVEPCRGGPAEVIGYLADITADRDIQAKAEATGRLAVLGEMATGLAHELNQPLAVMALAAENATRLLARPDPDSARRAIERLDRIGVQARRAREIVDHLRIFGRVEDGDAAVVALRDAVEGSLLLCGGLLRSAGIEVVTRLPVDLPPVVARAVPLEQTIVNLLMNARDAIVSTGRGLGRIELTATTDRQEVVLRVVDDGIGVPEAVLLRVFEPFFTTKEPGKGTGLGLSLAHATMRSFGGRIAVRNGDVGAVFELYFVTAAAAMETA